MVYDEISRSLILPFKHSDKSYVGRYLAFLFYHFKKDFFEDVDFIIPVPLHYKRLLKRKYNQAGILAKEIGKILNIPAVDGLVKRNKFVGTQKALSLKSRKDNVRGVFVLENREFVKGKTFLIVDDVMTTGATVTEIAGILKRGGARKIKVLTVARTVL
jgi:ComF family protein